MSPSRPPSANPANLTRLPDNATFTIITALMVAVNVYRRDAEAARLGGRRDDAEHYEQNALEAEALYPLVTDHVALFVDTTGAEG